MYTSLTNNVMLNIVLIIDIYRSTKAIRINYLIISLHKILQMQKLYVDYPLNKLS